MITVSYGKHIIQIPGVHLIGRERILYDRKIVSEKHSLTGATHFFDVKEDGRTVRYEVEIGTRWHCCSSYCTVRRNGVVIFSNK